MFVGLSVVPLDFLSESRGNGLTTGGGGIAMGWAGDGLEVCTGGDFGVAGGGVAAMLMTDGGWCMDFCEGCFWMRGKAIVNSCYMIYL